MRTTFVKETPKGFKVNLIEEVNGRKILRGTFYLETGHARACVWNWIQYGRISDNYPEDTGFWDVDLKAYANPCQHDGGKSFSPTGFICHKCSELLGD